MSHSRRCAGAPRWWQDSERRVEIRPKSLMSEGKWPRAKRRRGDRTSLHVPKGVGLLRACVWKNTWRDSVDTDPSSWPWRIRSLHLRQLQESCVVREGRVEVQAWRWRNDSTNWEQTGSLLIIEPMFQRIQWKDWDRRLVETLDAGSGEGKHRTARK